MKKYILLVVGVLMSVSLLSSCVALILGAGVAGGIVVTQDKVKLQYDTNFDHAWKATYAAIDKMGVISSKDEKAGTIEATIQESAVIARVTPVTAKSMKIEIKARKNMLPNMDLANKIINDINNRLHSSS